MLFFKSNYAEVTDEIRRIVSAFRKLPPAIAKRYMRQAMNKAIKPFLPAVRSVTPYATGNLVRSAKSIVRFYNKADHGAVVGVVGFSRKKVIVKRGGFVISGQGFHSHLVEYGSKSRRKKNGANCGIMPAARMVGSTFATHKGLILLTLEREMANGLEKATKKLAAERAG